MSAPDVHHGALLAAARRLAVEARELPCRDGRAAARYSRGGREAVVYDGRVFPGMSAAAERLADDKPSAKQRLEDLGILTPHGIVFDDFAAARPRIDRMIVDYAPLVCKPAIGTHGEATELDLTDGLAIRDHVRRHDSRDGRWLLEEQAPGRDLRLQAIGGRLAAACVREPAAVRGNGEHTLRELIALRNCRLAEWNPANRIRVDGVTEALLEEAGVGLDDVPPRGREVVLKRVANIGQGGTPVDVTAGLHPRWQDWMRTIAEGFDLSIFSVDAMTVGADRDPVDAARVLEVNARPEWIHHTFSEGRQHDLAPLILDSLLG